MNERNHNKEKKYSWLLKLSLILLLIVVLVGIMLTNKSKVENPTGQIVVDDQIDKGNIDITKEEASEEKQEVKLYFPNSSYIETADNTVGRMTIEIRSVVVEDEDIEDVVVEELLAGPQVEEAEKIFSDVVVNDVYIEENIAVVDFQQATIRGEGTLLESLSIESLVRTLDEIEGVDGIRVLLDGAEGETLAGHIDITDILTSEMYNF